MNLCINVIVCPGHYSTTATAAAAAAAPLPTSQGLLSFQGVQTSQACEVNIPGSHFSHTLVGPTDHSIALLRAKNVAGRQGLGNIARNAVCSGKN